MSRERKRQQTFTHVFPVPSEPDRPGVFGSERENKCSGLVEGGEDFWVTDNCYFDFPRLMPTPHAAGEFHLLTPTCKPPPTGGGSVMFKDLTPEYLKKLPESKPSTLTR
jgi:hypothetical protein